METSIHAAAIPTKTRFLAFLQRPLPIAPLVTFRVLFGSMMLFSILRFWINGWITDLYVKPTFYFPLMDMQWAKPLGYTNMHILFALMAIASLLIAIGFFYRSAIILFFLAFTYVEIIDITNYLNHYYFISVISFLLILLPANRYFSLDVRLGLVKEKTYVPAWTIGIIRLQLGLVYFFAGLAKLSHDWLIEAMPMKIWLPAKSYLPVVGPLMYKEWVAYLFSWFGAIYDLLIVFFLINKRTRPVAYCFVLIFHIATAIFFPGIGMFPYIMIVSSLIFFDSATHQKLLRFLGKKRDAVNASLYAYRPLAKKILFVLLGLYLLIQLLLPVRFLFYPSQLFWAEEGYRFSWRVMLMEKSGNTFFHIREPATGNTYEVNNSEFLTPLQEKMMSTQPDMMVQYAHYLYKIYSKRGLKRPVVYAEGYVTLNGRPSQLYIDTTVNLAAQTVGWQHYTWIKPLKENEK